jgi:hypothetical protein
MKVIDVNEVQFSRYLFQGLGRPYLIAQHSPHLLVSSALLEACCYNFVYDRQCTGTRTSYLLGLIKRTDDEVYIRQKILAALREPEEEMDVSQLFDFARIFAEEGSQEARQIMYEQFRQQAEYVDALGAEQIIQLDGFQGFCFVAETIGNCILRNKERWDDHYLLQCIEEQIGEAAVAEQLVEARRASLAIDTYLDVVKSISEQRIKNDKQRQDLSGKPYSFLREYLQQSKGQPSPVLLRKWAQAATQEDLIRAANDINKELELHELRSLLYIFTQRPFPFEIKALQEYIYHKDERISYRALLAISAVKSKFVRQLGIDLLADKTFQGRQLQLFVNNYRDGDEALFLSFLGTTHDDDVLHEAIDSLNDVYKRNPTIQAQKLLLEMYERGPCQLCRTKIVQNIYDIQCVPDWMVLECYYDADEDTRSIFQA